MHARFFPYGVFITLLVLPFIGRTQAVGHLTSYTKENGPSHRTLSSITKDKDGFLWLGTWNGLNRYDGTTFRTFDTFDKDNKFSLQSRRIIQVLDDDDYLWLLTYDKQVYWFDKKTEKFHCLSPFIAQSLGRTYPFNKIFMLTDDYLWLGTIDKGIVAVPRRDRSAKINYYGERAPMLYKLSSDVVNIMVQDYSGNIWVGTDKGLDCLKPAEKSYQNSDGTLFEGLITKSAQGKWGTAFIANGSDILFVKNGETRIKELNIPHDTLQALLFSTRSNLLYATSKKGRLLGVDLSTKNVVRLLQASNDLNGLYEDSQGNLWAEQGRSVLYLNRGTNVSRVFHPPYSKQNTKTPFFVFEDVNKRLWVSMRGGGFGYFDGSKQELRFSMSDVDAAANILPQYNYLFYYDRAGVLWFLQEDEGLNKLVFSNTGFRNHKLFIDKREVLHDEVRSMMLDPKGTLWLGTKSGNLYTRGQGQADVSLLPTGSLQGSDGIYSLLQDQTHTIWIGTKAAGLYRATPQRDDTYVITQLTKEQHGLDAEQIYALAVDDKQNIWVGTFDNGLYKIEQGFGKTAVKKINWTNKPTNQLSFNKIRHLLLDQNQNLWIATTEGLVIRSPEGETQFFYDGPESEVMLGDNDLQHIFSDANGTFYLCTSGGGLTRVEGRPFDTLTFTNYGVKAGLNNSFILGGIADTDGNLWLSTEGGLIKYDRENQRFINIGSGDQLNALYFSEKTIAVTANNSLFFGTNKGFLEVRPSDFKTNRGTVNLVLSRLWINNKEQYFVGGPDKVNIQYATELRLPYHQNNISIDFALTDFCSSSRNFSYRLLGLDSVWQQNGALSRATFTNLKPGEYVFEVRSENDFYISTPSRSLVVTISAPWWATWWAYALYFFLTLSVLLLVRRFVKSMWVLRQRVIIEQKMAEVKMQFFTNVSHELRTPLTLILSPVEQLLKSGQLGPENQQHAQLIDRNAKRMQRFVDQLLELRQIQENHYKLNKAPTDIVALIAYVAQGFQMAAEEKHVTVRCHLPTQPMFLQIDRDNIEIVLYNLLSNALKFAPADSEILISLRIDREGDKVEVSVCDRGPGVQEEALETIFELFHSEGVPTGQTEKSSGIGLSLAKELVQLHGGSIWAKNQDEGGFVVTFTLLKDTAVPTASDAAPQVKNQKEFLLSESFENEKRDEPVLNENQSRLLIVEDNADLLAFLTAQLRNQYHIVQAGNGHEGLKAALDHPPELIISDVMMPGMDGIELVRQLRNATETSHIPIILLSAKHAVETQIQGLEYGADYYITKPFHLDFLQASIENLLKKRKQLFDNMLDQREWTRSEEDLVITANDREFLSNVIAIVDEKMEYADLNIDEIADALHLGRNTFYKKFKSLTNITPVEFVRDRRLQKAKLLLDQGADNIATVAYQVGFNNPKYFSTCFREKFGISPKAYSQKTLGTKNSF